MSKEWTELSHTCLDCNTTWSGKPKEKVVKGEKYFSCKNCGSIRLIPNYTDTRKD